MFIYFIRHGQTAGDVEGRYGGAYDDHLTELGKQQAELVTSDLLRRGIQSIISSPLIRAVETARIINAQLKIPFKIVPEFRECNRYGIISGMTKGEARERYPHEVEKISDINNTVQGAESYSDFKVRVGSALKALNLEESFPVAVVTHGGVIKFIYREILGLGEVSVQDCGFVKMRVYYGSQFELEESSGIE